MDMLNLKGIARFLPPSFCQDSGELLLTACEELVSTAAARWRRASFDSRHRDDIAISVCIIRTPPIRRTQATSIIPKVLISGHCTLLVAWGRARKRDYKWIGNVCHALRQMATDNCQTTLVL